VSASSKVSIALFVFVALGSLTVQAGDKQPNSKFVEVKESLGLIRNAYLVIDDQVEGKCWTNTDQVKQKARLTLERSGISVYDEPLFIISPVSTNIVITGLGLRSDAGTCFGSIEVSSFREIFTYFGDVSIKYSGSNFSRNSVAISSSNLNSSFLSAVDTFISQLSSDVIAGRRNQNVNAILEKQVSSKPVTMREFVEMFKKASENK
jgi:hypothetical protein